MGWKVVKRRIGKAGGYKERSARQREWDRKYGDGQWCVGYVIDGEFVSQEDAIETIYNTSYAAHFAAHPDDLATLLRTAKKLRNPHAEATSGVDLQVPAILAFLRQQGLQLQGQEVVDIGTWKGQASHPISVTLSPLHIAVVGNPRMTLEKFWQSKKCLAVWESED